MLLLPAILVAGVVVFLRLRRKLRETSDEATALQKRVAALEQRTFQLEGAQWQAEARARNVRFREERPARVNSQVTPSASTAHRPEPAANRLRITESLKEFAEVRNLLEILYTEVSRTRTVEESHIAEFDTVVDRLQRATGCDLSVWLGIPPKERPDAAVSPGQLARVSIGRHQSRNYILFHTSILSLRAFCSYQIAHSQSDGFVPPPPKAAGLIH